MGEMSLLEAKSKISLILCNGNIWQFSTIQQPIGDESQAQEVNVVGSKRG